MSELLNVVCKAIGEVKGERIIQYDFHTLNPFIDDVIICSASNIRQVYAIANHVKDCVREEGFHVRAMEGSHESRWVLVDLDTVIVHVFLEEERAIFQLETLYADLPHEAIAS